MTGQQTNYNAYFPSHIFANYHNFPMHFLFIQNLILTLNVSLNFTRLLRVVFSSQQCLSRLAINAVQ